MIKSIIIIIIFYLLIGCVSKNHTKTDKKIMEVINVRQYEYVWTPTLKSGHDVLSSFEADAVEN